MCEGWEVRRKERKKGGENQPLFCARVGKRMKGEEKGEKRGRGNVGLEGGWIVNKLRFFLMV